MLTSLAITLIGYREFRETMKEEASNYGYEMSAILEMANAASGFPGGYGLSKSIVANKAGQKTQLASMM